MSHKKLSTRILPLALSAAMLFSMMPANAFAMTMSPLGTHKHDKNCGYAETVKGVDCVHTGENSCGTRVEKQEEISCDKECVGTNDDGEIKHAEDCAYSTAVEGETAVECNHTDDCGYVSAVDGSECTHVCGAECVLNESEDNCICNPIIEGDGTHTNEACLFYVSLGEDGFTNIDGKTTGAAGAWGSDYETATEFAINSKEDFLAFVALSQVSNEEEYTYNSFEGKTVTLNCDITLSGEEAKLTPIGMNTARKPDGFQGIFDGQAHTISGAVISVPQEMLGKWRDCGLFGAASGTIKNLTLDNVNIDSDTATVGAVVGKLHSGGIVENCNLTNSTITSVGAITGGIVGENSSQVNDCHVTGGVIMGNLSVGGIVGKSNTSGSSVNGCYTDASTIVRGKRDVGGIVGGNSGMVEDCTNYATVKPLDGLVSTPQTSAFGGIIGGCTQTTPPMKISNCVNYGSVEAEGFPSVGGIAGNTAPGFTITDCINEGNIAGSKPVGGIVGRLAVKETIQNCRNTGAISGTENVGGIAGIVTNRILGRTTGDLIIENCATYGTVTGTTNVGGIIGLNEDYNGDYAGDHAAQITNSVVAGEISGTTNVGGIIGNNADGSANGYPATADKVLWLQAGELDAVGIGFNTATQITDCFAFDNKGMIAGSDPTVSLPEQLLALYEGEELLPPAFRVTATFYNGETQTVVLGSKITLPTALRSGYYFGGWANGDVNYAAGTDYILLRDTAFDAQWNWISTEDSTPPQPKPEPPKTDAESGTTTVVTEIKPETSGSTATVTVTEKNMNTAIDSAISAADKTDTAAVVEIKVAAGANTDTVKVIVPAASVATLAESKRKAALTVSSPLGAVTFDAPALMAVAAAAQGKTVTIMLASVNTKTLDETQKNAVGDGVAVNLSVTAGTNVVSDFGNGAAYIRLPYVRKDATKTISVYFIAENGAAVRVPGATYDVSAGMVRFTTEHFSLYAVMEEIPLPFTDVAETDWYYDAVHYAYRNGILTGTGDTTFSPMVTTTRATLVTMLYRLEKELQVTGGGIFADVATDAWYAEAVAWAAKSGIANGDGTNFSPNDPITREQLATMLWRYTKYKGVDVSVGENTNILSYSDVGEASEYAIPALQWACGAGILNGKGDGILDPAGISTRAGVAAAMLQRLP